MPDPPPIVILAPTRGELLATTRRLGLPACGPLFRGAWRDDHGRQPILAAVTGIGRDRARQAVEQLCRHHAPAALLVIGFAGGLDPRLRAGQAARAGWVVDEAGRAWELRDGAAPRAVSPRGAPAFASAACADAAWAWGGGIDVGVVQVDRVVTTPADKAALRRRFAGAAVVDMESASFAAFAADRGLPLTILRAVSDPADAALPPGLLACVSDDGAARTGAALRLLLRRPLLLPTMARLGMAAHACGVNLADAVVQWLSMRTPSRVE